MKTVTKTFYVNNSCMEDLKNYRSFDYRYFSTSQSMDNENEIQISWTEPERKIEISESEFESLFDKDVYQITMAGGTKAMDKNVLKLKLFGASDE